MNLLTPCLRILAALMLCGAAACPQLTAHEPEPERTWQVNGESLDLLPRWPAAGATKPMDVTVEIWVKPDQASIDRERSIVWLFSNRGGADVAGLSVSLNQGVPHVNAFGSRLDAAEKLNANRWTHIVVTFNSKTINKRVRLWIDGKRVDQDLVLNPFPTKFERFQLFGDPWGLKRIYSGDVAEFRFSKTVRYRDEFRPPTRHPRDEQTVVAYAASNANEE